MAVQNPKMATAIPTISSLMRSPFMVNEAIIIQVPNKPIIQLRHIGSSFSLPSIQPYLHLPTIGSIKRRLRVSKFLCILVYKSNFDTIIFEFQFKGDRKKNYKIEGLERNRE
jgi:hypothetical protein